MKMVYYRKAIVDNLLEGNKINIHDKSSLDFFIKKYFHGEFDSLFIKELNRLFRSMQKDGIIDIVNGFLKLK